MNTGSCITIFVNGILYDTNHSILMLKRSVNDKLLPGYYEFPGGRLQMGENLEVALRRKFLQEAGIEVAITGFAGSRFDANKRGTYLRVFFNVELYDNADSTELPKPKLSDSHDDYIWYNDKTKFDIKIAPDCARMINSEAGRIATEAAIAAPVSSQGDHHDSLIIYTDGGSRGNPGPSAAAFVILDEQERILEKGGEFIGRNTNDQAEYQAVRLALVAAKKYTPMYVHLRLDSMLVVNQINGIYKIKNKSLFKIHRDIRELMKHFRSVDLRHISRDYNRLADAQVNKILDYNEV